MVDLTIRLIFGWLDEISLPILRRPHGFVRRRLGRVGEGPRVGEGGWGLSLFGLEATF